MNDARTALTTGANSGIGLATTLASFLPSTRHARMSEVTQSAVPPTMNVMTTMSQSGR